MTLREFLESRMERHESRAQEYDKDDLKMSAQFCRGKLGEARFLLHALSNKVLDTDINEN